MNFRWIFIVLILAGSVSAQYGGHLETSLVGDSFVFVADKDSATILAEENALTWACVFINMRLDSLQIWALITEFGKRGEICKIHGHQWRNGRPGEGSTFSYADYHPNTVFRTCTVCGKCEAADTRLKWK